MLFVSTFRVNYSVKFIIVPLALRVSSSLKREIFVCALLGVNITHGASRLSDQNQFPLRIFGFVSNISHCVFIFTQCAPDGTLLESVTLPNHDSSNWCGYPAYLGGKAKGSWPLFII